MPPVDCEMVSGVISEHRGPGMINPKKTGLSSVKATRIAIEDPWLSVPPRNGFGFAYGGVMLI